MKTNPHEIRNDAAYCACVLTALVTSRGLDSHGHTIPGLHVKFADLPGRLRRMADAIEVLAKEGEAKPEGTVRTQHFAQDASEGAGRVNIAEGKQNAS